MNLNGKGSQMSNMTPKLEDVMGDGAEKSPSEGIEIVEKNYCSRPKLERLREPEECAAFSNRSIAPCLSINSTLTVQNSFSTTAAILSLTQQAQNGLS
jgi:hypothetical protein